MDDTFFDTLRNLNLPPKGYAIFGSGPKWGIGDFNVDELIETAELIDELPFVRLEHVIRYKEIRAGSKDLRHLEALQASSYR